MIKFLRPIFLSVIAVLASSDATTQVIVSPPVVSVTTDPTEFGSLRMDPFEATAPENREWVLVLTTSYFNQWNGTWHTVRVHQDRNLQGQPIQDDELRAVEQAFPDDEIFRWDVEGSRIDLLMARGFSNGAAIHLKVPWITIGAPSWDRAAEAVHHALSVDDYFRQLFPRGQTFFYLRTREGTILRRDELARSGLGDVALSIGFPLAESKRMRHRVAVAMELPTGRTDSLHGSGGIDAGVRWFGLRESERNDWIFGAGFTYQSPEGSFFIFERSNTFHLSADFIHRWSGRTVLHIATRLDSSPLAGVTSLAVKDPVLFYRFGIQREVGRDQWLSLEIGEEVAPQIGVDADFSFHVGYGFRFGRLHHDASAWRGP